MNHGSLGLGETLEDWYVTNGERWVGPVDTRVLLRGVATGDVSRECMVWRRAWSGWRPLSRVRELHVLERTRASRGAQWTPTERWSPAPNHAAQLAKAGTLIASATDEREVVTLALSALVTEMRATGGLAHRPKGTLGPLVTSVARGAALTARLGDEVRPDDSAIRAARFGATIIDKPAHSRRGVATLERTEALPESVRGVALAPIYANARLIAVLEVAKTDHAFRANDGALLRAVMRAAAAKITREGWARRAHQPS